MRKWTVYEATVGRDKGKRFLLTEKSAYDAEWWAARAFLALARNGVEVPDGAADSGLAGIAQVGLKSLAKLDPADAKPLLDEMLSCVTVVLPANVINPETERPMARPLTAEDIEEVATLASLRVELFSLHLDFSLADVLSKSTSATDQDSSATRTSPAR